MGELYPPTAADYAQSAADHAREENEKLTLRVAKLEGAMMAVMFRLDRLEGRRPLRMMGSEHGEY